MPIYILTKEFIKVKFLLTTRCRVYLCLVSTTRTYPHRCTCQLAAQRVGPPPRKSKHAAYLVTELPDTHLVRDWRVPRYRPRKIFFYAQSAISTLRSVALRRVISALGFMALTPGSKISLSLQKAKCKFYSKEGLNIKKMGASGSPASAVRST